MMAIAPTAMPKKLADLVGRLSTRPRGSPNDSAEGKPFHPAFQIGDFLSEARAIPDEDVEFGIHLLKRFFQECDPGRSFRPIFSRLGLLGIR
jgi:hypothetical protein